MEYPTAITFSVELKDGKQKPCINVFDDAELSMLISPHSIVCPQTTSISFNTYGKPATYSAGPYTRYQLVGLVRDMAQRIVKYPKYFGNKHGTSKNYKAISYENVDRILDRYNIVDCEDEYCDDEDIGYPSNIYSYDRYTKSRVLYGVNLVKGVYYPNIR